MFVLKVLVAVVILIGLVLLAVGLFDGNRFVTVHEEFALEKLSRSARFVMVSDLHNKVYGRKNEKVIELIRKANPDFILICGDLVTANPNEDIANGCEFVNSLSPYYKIYYSPGNHECKIKCQTNRYPGKYEALMKSIIHKNVHVLDNETVVLSEYNIAITGLNIGLEYFAHFKLKEMEPGYIERNVSKSDGKRCNILMAHNPDYFDEYAKWGADLVISGHVHGGIMRLPLLGGVISPSYQLFPKYDGGIYKSAKSTMLLGHGLGSHTFPLRFFNPAKLYIVDIKPGSLREA